MKHKEITEVTMTQILEVFLNNNIELFSKKNQSLTSDPMGPKLEDAGM